MGRRRESNFSFTFTFSSFKLNNKIMILLNCVFYIVKFLFFPFFYMGAIVNESKLYKIKSDLNYFLSDGRIKKSNFY